MNKVSKNTIDAAKEKVRGLKETDRLAVEIMALVDAVGDSPAAAESKKLAKDIKKLLKEHRKGNE